ncbi:MAG: SRPBCC domain-containing protein [Hyphomicrobiales bacterium]
MARYLLSYRLPPDYRRSQESVAAMTAWFDELGDAVVERGSPAEERGVVGTPKPEQVLSGFSLVGASDMEEAKQLAARCPLLQHGSIEVAELAFMDAGRPADKSPEGAARPAFQKLPGPDYARSLLLQAPIEQAYEAAATAEGLARWWTPDASGSNEEGGQLTFTFGGPGKTIMRVDALDRPEAVRWTCLSSDHAPDWAGTRVAFRFRAIDAGSSELTFVHQGLRPGLECWEMCEAGWDQYLPSLAAYLETGRGRPRGSEEWADERARRATPPRAS